MRPYPDTEAIARSTITVRSRQKLDWHSTVPRSHTDGGWRPDIGWNIDARDITGWGLDVDLAVFGLAHKLNRMPQLQEIHLEYRETEESYHDRFSVNFGDGSLRCYAGPDLEAVFSTNLSGMKQVGISGTLCDECGALLASAMERPKGIVPFCLLRLGIKGTPFATRKYPMSTPVVDSLCNDNRAHSLIYCWGHVPDAFVLRAGRSEPCKT